jgi:two-component system chemotaxis response regulator CheY
MVKDSANAKLCLVVDDSRVVRKVARRILEDLGFDVAEAGDGAEALAWVRTAVPDVILLDWNMPVMNGLEFVRELRALQASAQVPVLMVTTNAESADIAGAKEAGVNDYVVKPFTPDTLQEKINALLAK